jgi:hypothetical protein
MILAIGATFIYLGKRMQARPDIYSGTVKAIVTLAKCYDNQNILTPKQVSTFTTCDLSFKYVVNGVEYVKDTKTTKTSYFLNQRIDVRYNPKNPQDVTLEASKKTKGTSVIIAGIATIVIALVYGFMTFRPTNS